MTVEPGSFLVAHRGDREGGRENTLAAFQAAADAGASYIECDVQFCGDMTPLIIHDGGLSRLYGATCEPLVRRSLTEIMAAVPHFEPLTLAQMLQWLAAHPQLTLFMELKPPILRRYAAARVVAKLAPLLAGLEPRQLVIISGSAAWLEACAASLPFRLGWVAGRHRRPACPLAYIFLPKRLASGFAARRETGTRIVAYTSDRADEVRALLDAGADLVETDCFAAMRRQLARPQDPQA